MSDRYGLSRREILGIVAAASGLAMSGGFTAAFAQALKRTPGEILGPFYPAPTPNVVWEMIFRPTCGCVIFAALLEHGDGRERSGRRGGGCSSQDRRWHSAHADTGQTWVGHGTGRTCDACGLQITPEDIEH